MDNTTLSQNMEMLVGVLSEQNIGNAFVVVVI
jgi:hypothetical protein